MSLLIFGGVILQWPIGRLSDFWGRRTVLMLVSLTAVFVSLGMVFLGETHSTILFVLATLLGGLVFTLYPLSISHAADYLQAKDIVAGTGGLLIANSVGAVAGPLCAGLSMHYFKPQGLFLYVSAVCGLLVVFTVWRTQQRASIPIDEQVNYVAVPRTTPLVSEFDPRGDEVDLVN